MGRLSRPPDERVCTDPTTTFLITVGIFGITLELLLLSGRIMGIIGMSGASILTRVTEMRDAFGGTHHERAWSGAMDWASAIAVHCTGRLAQLATCSSR
jgi:hypothetical protein